MCASESLGERVCVCVSGQFPRPAPPKNLFLSSEVEGDVPLFPPLCKCYRFYPRTGTEGFPAQSVLKLLYIPPSLFHLVKIAGLGSPILPARHPAPGEGERWAVLSDPL